MEQTKQKLETYLDKKVEEFDRLNWLSVSRYGALSEDFIRAYQDKLEWRSISESQSLSEGFIMEFEDKVNWLCISYSQNISFKFVMDNLLKLDIDWVLRNHQAKLTLDERKILKRMHYLTESFADDRVYYGSK